MKDSGEILFIIIIGICSYFYPLYIISSFSAFVLISYAAQPRANKKMILGFLTSSVNSDVRVLHPFIQFVGKCANNFFIILFMPFYVYLCFLFFKFTTLALVGGILTFVFAAPIVIFNSFLYEKLDKAKPKGPNMETIEEVKRLAKLNKNSSTGSEI